MKLPVHPLPYFQMINLVSTQLISYDSKILTNQYATLENMEDFPAEVASARTFVFVREIEPLLNAGLIKGRRSG